MKFKLWFPLLCLVVGYASCNDEEKNTAAKPENDIDAARDFIRSALDGKFKDARRYLLADSSNIHYMDVAERNYQKANPEEKSGYQRASINIHQVNPVNDSTTIVIYSNSFKNNHDTLKVLRISGQWVIDLKYLYEHDMDTTLYLKPNTDTLQ